MHHPHLITHPYISKGFSTLYRYWPILKPYLEDCEQIIYLSLFEVGTTASLKVFDSKLAKNLYAFARSIGWHKRRQLGPSGKFIALWENAVTLPFHPTDFAPQKKVKSYY